MTIQNWFAEAPPLRFVPKAFTGAEELRELYSGSMPRANRRRLHCGPSVILAVFALAVYAGILVVTSPAEGSSKSPRLSTAEDPAGPAGRTPLSYATANP